MSILARFSDIMASNVNTALDKLEDPSKMIEQMLRNALKDLGEVKKETAKVMAEEKHCERVYADLKQKVDSYEKAAKNAVLAGDDAGATTLFEKKARVAADLATAETTYEAAKVNATKMREMHNKISADIEDLKRRQGSIKATISVAKTQKKINKMGGMNATAVTARFNAYEEKAQNMLDQAEAEATLNMEPVDEAEALATKYATSTVAASDELVALKAKMGLTKTPDPEPAPTTTEDNSLEALKARMAENEE